MRLSYFKTTAAILAVAAGVTFSSKAFAQQYGGAYGQPYYTAPANAAPAGYVANTRFTAPGDPQPDIEASPSDVTEPMVAPGAPTTVPGMPPMTGGQPPMSVVNNGGNLASQVKELQKQVDDLKDLREEFERVDKVEKALDKHLEGIAKKAADAAKKPQQKFFGRIHLDSWTFHKDSPGIGFFENRDPTAATFGNDPQDRVNFRRIRIGMKGDILDTMTYKVQTEFADPNDFEYRDLYIGWKQLPNNQVLLLGNQKRPLGMDHLNSSRYNTFLERPAVIEAFNEDARRIGLTMYGHSDDESVNWTYGVYNLERTQDDGQFIGDSLQLSLNGRIAATPWYDETSGGRGYLHLAVAGMYARPDGDEPSGSGAGDVNSNDGRFRTRSELRSSARWLDTGRITNAEHYEILGSEMALNVGAFQFVAEYQTTWLQIGGAEDVFFHGGYFQASYFLTGEHSPIERTKGVIGRVKPFENFFVVDRMSGGTGWGLGAWQVAARYSFLDLTDGAVTGGEGGTFTAGLNWWWTPYSRMQFNYLYGQIDNRGPIGGFSSGNFHAIGTRWMVDF